MDIHGGWIQYIPIFAFEIIYSPGFLGVLKELPLNLKSRMSVQSKDRARLGATVGLVVLHSFLHEAGQKNCNFSPGSGSTFLQCKIGSVDTHEAQSFLFLFLYQNASSSVQFNNGAKQRVLEKYWAISWFLN